MGPLDQTVLCDVIVRTKFLVIYRLVYVLEIARKVTLENFANMVSMRLNRWYPIALYQSNESKNPEWF